MMGGSMSLLATVYTQQIHRAHTPSPGHFHSHDLHDLRHRRSIPGLERARAGDSVAPIKIWKDHRS